MNKKGFTLLELLAVIVILSILVILAVPKVTDILRTSKQKTYETNKEVIEKAAKGYILDHPEEKEVSLQILIDNDLLDTIPIDPRTNEEMDGYLVLYDGKGDYKTGEYSDGYNSPELSKNMYPVKWNGTAWQVTNKDDVDWYLYNGDIDNSGDTNKDDGQGAFTADKWANVHITTEVLSEGDTIEEADLNLYVWIPRYTYLLDEPSKTIAIKYTQGINDDNTSNYLSHPGFTFGDKEVTGIWVAKFEMSANTTSNEYGTPTGDALAISAPNKKPWRAISVNNIFNEARSMGEEYGVNANSHMIKSSEWAAVAYLTEAIRDKEEVWINNQGWYDSTNTTDNYKFITTGCASSTTKNGYANNATTAVCPIGYDYKTGGVKASTTGNEYGIYDISGGSWEYVATYINDDTNSRLTSSSYALALSSSENKYKEMIDVYGASDTNNYDNSESLTTGLALHETSTTGSGASSWHSDYSYYPFSNYPIISRGGHFYGCVNTGLFAFSRKSGGPAIYIGWRATLVL